MYTNSIAFALALAPSVYLSCTDVSLDGDGIPREYNSNCDAVVDVTWACDTYLWGDWDGGEDRRVCTNDSFDVGRAPALCAGCIRQNRRVDAHGTGSEPSGE
ncbi:hypothetical protein MRS44_018099 [Fusarium solani]|uniref:uncharacterized protein n=1 Tax=Fusarium solani TaxID=169388 RepID=UPI0032C3E124|nr:hypothetical protein MRS44_018099 [Fusarium solani]